MFIPCFMSLTFYTNPGDLLAIYLCIHYTPYVLPKMPCFKDAFYGFWGKSCKLKDDALWCVYFFILVCYNDKFGIQSILKSMPLRN